MMLANLQPDLAMLAALGVGFIAGIAASVPVAGPVAVLILRNAVEGKRHDAIVLAMGSALAESIYAAVAFLGIAALTTRFPIVLSLARVISVVVLLTVGVYLVRKRIQPENEIQSSPLAKARKGLLGFTMTILNPTIAVSWTAVITMLHSNALLPSKAIDSVPFALGVGLGIVGWFMGFTWVVRHFRKKIHPTTLASTMHVMGWLVLALAVFMGVRTTLSLLH